MPERGDLLLAERSTGGHRNVAEALQHDPPTQRSRLSSPGTAQLDHSCLDRRLPSPARSSLRPDCVRRPGSDDELAPLGLDSVLAGLLHLIRTRRKVLKDWPNQQAGRAILSLSDWYKTSGRSRASRTNFLTVSFGWPASPVATCAFIAAEISRTFASLAAWRRLILQDFVEWEPPEFKALKTSLHNFPPQF